MKPWLVGTLALGGALLYRARRRGDLQRAAANVRAFDLPSAGLYDGIAGTLLGGFYDQVAAQITGACSRGEILEASSGPGRLALRLALSAPSAAITGLDISADMVQVASRRALQAGLASHIHFDIGDVAALPYADGRFDCVVSTLSLHHWIDPARGLVEIYRVLKPGAEAWIYDLTGPFWQAIHRRPSLAALAAASPFRGGEVHFVRWPGPLSLVTRLRLRRAGDAREPSSGSHLPERSSSG